MMLKNPKYSFKVFLAIIAIAAIVLPTKTFCFTYTDLIYRLMDLERLATLPEQGEFSKQFSSYDRESRYDAKKDEYIKWGANADAVGFLRMEGVDKVLAEMKGPGLITRIWSAYPRSGHLKIFLDDSKLPVIDLPFEDFFKGTVEPFTLKSLSYWTEAYGGNNYYPIPFRKSCKIVASGDWGLYYHIDYTAFPQGTVMPTFDVKYSQDELDAFAFVEDFFTNSLGTTPHESKKGEEIFTKKVVLPPGKSEIPFELTEGGVISSLRVKIDGIEAKEEEITALKELTIALYWDKETTPSVWSPLGDFFGTAPGLNEFHGLPLGIQKGWMYSYWYMPFEKGAKLEFQNDGKVEHTLQLEIIYSPLTGDLSNLGRFHAKWQRNTFPRSRQDRWPDYSMLRTSGRGRFVGVMLHNYRPTDERDPVAAPGEYWWGEGDEKFFVDGEKFPSFFGTGSEDYFGYAWCKPDRFSRAFHSQTHNESELGKGNTSVNRFQINDNIPFQKSFDGYIEKYYNDNYARYGMVVYWYLNVGGEDPYNQVSLEERISYFLKDELSSDEKQAIEALPIKPEYKGSNLDVEKIRREIETYTAQFQNYCLVESAEGIQSLILVMLALLATMFLMKLKAGKER